MTRDTLRDLRQPFYMVEHELLNRGLSVNAIAVYNVLRRHANRDRQCFPAIRTIAKTLRIGKSSVGRALEELKAAVVIRVTQRLDVHGDRASNLYDLLPLGVGGCPATGTRVPLQVRGVPLQTHRCPATGTELYTIELEPQKKRESLAHDELWEYFSAGFRKHADHPPRPSAKQRAAFKELTNSLPVELIRSKIDAWWEYPCPRLIGNRTLGAFLQWFDDIPCTRTTPVGSSLSLEQRRTEMAAGTPLGRELYVAAIGDAKDKEAKIRTLLAYKYASNTKEAEDVIEACEAAHT